MPGDEDSSNQNTDGIRTFASLGGGANLDSVSLTGYTVTDEEVSDATVKTELRLKDLEDESGKPRATLSKRQKKEQDDLREILARSTEGGSQSELNRLILVQTAQKLLGWSVESASRKP